MKIIFQPVKPFFISQWYGDNKACVSLDGTNKVISCDGLNPPAGYKSLYGAKGHQAIDLGTWHGQEVYACQSGTVYQIDTDKRSGLDVRIEHDVNGVKCRTIYEHLMGYQVTVGEKVEVGQLIGWADNTGYSSGDHLHLVLEIWNGKTWEKADPLDYMEPIFAKDFLKMVNQVKWAKETIAKLLDNWAYKLRK
jgi:murein DD-endopeptidase MepM/ murein hydrolase activator NlpD